MKQILRLLMVMVLVCGASFAFAQGVTTSSMTGSVIDSKGESLPGATVQAVHTPSGSKYGTVTNADGRFIIPAMRVGGPYTITVAFVGYKDQVIENVYLSLGTAATIDVKMIEESVELNEVSVVAEKNDLFSVDRTGAATNLSNKQMMVLPTISRSINDFTRLTPQSNGTSFGGRDNRYNNYTVDGNIYNNNFGLGSGQFAGANPISLDAIEEVQVNLAPFDVRQSGFTGANVNAITKSGNNKFEGSLYYFFRNDQLVGNKVGEQSFDRGDSQNTIRGFRLGGPILKDKIFFFVSYEKEEEAVPGFTKVAARDGLVPDGINISRVPAAQLDFVRAQMQSIYGYDPGAYEGYGFSSEQTRFNARLDFNISSKHKLAIRYNSYFAFNDVPTNGNSIRYISTRYFNTDRTGIEAMNFRNANYTNDRKVTSVVAELNSIITDNISNQFNVGFNSVTDPKRGVPGGQDFPFIEVLEPDGGGNLLYYFSLGNELFTVGNLLENNIFNITNNTTIYKGKHTITGGVNFEYMTFKNAFNPTFHGFYRFTSYQSFVDAVINKNQNVYPAAFAVGYSFTDNSVPPVDEVKFAQLGFYAQDEFQYSKNLKLTAGLRIDLPFYPIDLPSNPLLDDLNKEFTNPLTGDSFTPDVANMPKVRPLWSPRVGFNWDVKGDRSIQVRGGTGIFSGRIPFVWLSNQVNGNGVTRGGIGYEGAAVVSNNILFNPDVHAYKPDPASAEPQLSNELNLTDRDFKLPQIWRSNLAVDYKLPGGVVATVELMHSKDLSAPIATNPVLRAPDGNLAGPDARPYWTGSYSNDANFRNVFYLTNLNNTGSYMSATFQLRKDFANGLSVQAAYTRSRTRDYGLGNGSQAISLWGSVVQTDRNNPELSYSRFDLPHRVVGSISYNIGKLTTVTLFYQGQNAGRFSYTYSGNFGDSGQRLMYVPNNASELNFQEYTSGGKTFTATDQEEAFDAYIDQDEYLSGMRGKVVERFGAKLPFYHRFDFRIVQDIPVFSHKLKDNEYSHKFQLTFDILNAGNLLNSEWGVEQSAFQTNLLNYRGRNAGGEPIYRMNLVSGTTDLPTSTSRLNYSLGQTWRGQIGIRYIF